MVGKYIPQDISNLLEVVSKNLVPFPSYTEKKEVVGSCSNGLRGGEDNISAIAMVQPTCRFNFAFRF